MKTRSLIITFLLIASTGTTFAQSFSVGTDLVSRYVWRGSDYGESLALQPGLAFSYGGLQIGTWASYSVSEPGATANEHDLFASFTFGSEASGILTVGVTDYYFPSPGAVGFFDVSGDGEGAHWLEPFVSYTLPGSSGISVGGAAFVHNDPDHSMYLSASIPARIDGVDLEFSAGAVSGRSAFYGTDGFSFVHAAMSVTRRVPLTDRYSLPVSVSYIVNPHAERTFLVFGVSL